MKTVKCDLCNRTEPEVDCRYNKRKKFGWFKSECGEWERELDICRTCWTSIEAYILVKIKENK
jgi:hypothetical protein